MAVSVHLCYYAGARTAAGVPEERVVLADPATVATVLADVTLRRGAALERVVAACSFLLDGEAVHDRRTPVRDGCRLDVLPPFAGG